MVFDRIFPQFANHFPYKDEDGDRFGWREIGVTPGLIRAFAEEENVKVTVM